MVLAGLVRRGYQVLIPFGEGHPYDLAVWLGGPTFLRIQCKTAWPVGGCLVFNCRSTDHGRGPRSYRGLADIFGVYFPPDRTVYLVSIDGVANFEGRLRLEPTRNNQRRGIRFAADFEIDRWSLDLLREIAVTQAPQKEPLASVA
jgi:PD-(D/E)XK nuclease superfamily protein